jgi:putative transcriptional regulator
MENTLKSLRGTKKQSDIAEAVGITASYYGMIENGLRNPSLEVAKKLSNYFNVPTDQIFFAN